MIYFGSDPDPDPTFLRVPDPIPDPDPDPTPDPDPYEFVVYVASRQTLYHFRITYSDIFIYAYAHTPII
jgi:hypothetical protein